MQPYMDGPEWQELVVEEVLGRQVQVWRRRLRRVTDMLEVSAGTPELDLFVQGERRITYGAFRRAIDAGAAQLAGRGLGEGDSILILLYNSPEFLLAQWSAWQLGALPVLGNRWWSPRELADVVASLRPKLLITDVPSAQLEGISVERLHPDDLRSWWDLPPAPFPPVASRDEDEVALVSYTAGSTGGPKGVQISHRNLLWSQQTQHVLGGGRPPIPRNAAEQKVTLVTTPLFHNGGLHHAIAALFNGNRVVMLEGRFDPETALEVLSRERVTHWTAVPVLFNRIFRHPNFDRYDLSSLVMPATGGMPIPAQLIADTRAKLPHAPFGMIVGYGMSEMTFVTLTQSDDLVRHPGTSGRTIPGVELRVDAPNAAGEGELMARSAALMVGYFNSDIQPIDDEGWYRTGDVGRIDAEGYLYVTGRCKDMVIRGGENISCPHVETAIVGHPDVLEAAVFGIPDEELGEALAAAVYPRQGAPLDAAALDDHCRQHLAHFEVPSRWLILDEPLPVVPAGKVDKTLLRSRILAS